MRQTFFVILLLLTQTVGCAGGTMGTGVRKILKDKDEEELHSEYKFPSILPSHTSSCIFKEDDNSNHIRSSSNPIPKIKEISFHPDRLSTTVNTSGECNTKLSPKNETMNFSVVLDFNSHGQNIDSLPPLSFSVEQQGQNGVWNQIESGRFLIANSDGEYQMELSTKLFVLGKVYRLKVFPKASHKIKQDNKMLRSIIFQIVE